ncbi:hypothetical protein PHMEG_00023938 [Phytophthora megakarya]|uniref:Uncharacterized protein n=1 Tax=Phytophthora megakarya TaxID=4795 RepID=A0A225VI62_9STRA|nr:hypothetical protein PHMEG_00023938 [Phytophthora megakarya]
MSQEPTDTPQPRGLGGPASRGTASGRAGLPASGPNTAHTVESTALSASLGNADTNWPMRNSSLEKKEIIRHLREIVSASSRGRPWTPNFRSDCLFLPVVADPLALQIGLEGLRFADAQNGQFISDASFLWGLLTIEQIAWNEIARGRHYSVHRDVIPFQTLDLETASAFPVEDDGDALTLTREEQELLGTAMMTRLRLAHVRPRDWSESDASRPEPKRRRGSTDMPLSVPSWPGSNGRWR